MDAWPGTQRLDGIRVLLVETEPQEDRLACLQAGFQYRVPKPVALSRLAGVVALLALKKPDASTYSATMALSP
jgi:CheY-like chemotaxis protein